MPEIDDVLRVEVAQRARAEMALREAKRAAESASGADSALLTNMSHQVRTPLNGVIGVTNLLLATQLTPEQRRFAETVQGCGKALLRFLNGFLDLSKIEVDKLTVEPIPFDLGDLLAEVSELLATQALDKGLDLRVRYAPDAPRSFLGDPCCIRQVILNLAGNAIQFSKRGHVAISVECEEPGEEEARMRIAVEDTGIGIAPEALERIVDGFTRTDTSTTSQLGGTGLGLAISNRLIELMGGGIGARSRVGEGSTFWVWLPLPLCDPRMTVSTSYEEPTSEVLPTRFDARVLVVEDNAVNQLVAMRMLEKLGCRADVAADGCEALIAMAELRYDLVLMGCETPETDEFEATAEIRGRWDGTRCTPIVAMGTGAEGDDRERYLEAGMNDYLAKPVGRNALRRVLARWTRASAPAPLRAGP